MFDIIAFDADDTLWENERLYTSAKDKFVGLLSRYHAGDWVEQRLNETEIDNIRYYGYGIKSFVLSMIETAAELSGGYVQAEEIQQILNYAKQVLTAEVCLFEHVENTLETLSASYSLMLITKGEQVEQEGKLRRSGLGKYFRFVEVVVDKDLECYQRVLAKYQIPANRFMMVGNSLRSDILPVLMVGGKAVYIPYAYTWSHELEVENFNPGDYDELEHMGQLPGYLENLMKKI